MEYLITKALSYNLLLEVLETYYSLERLEPGEDNITKALEKWDLL